jgi:hypothetical protein
MRIFNDATRTERDHKIVDYFVNQHLTCREISKLVNLSGPGVWKVLQRCKVPTESGEWAIVQCTECHVSFRSRRARYRRTHRHFCSKKCYMTNRHNPRYQKWRHGQRIARRIVKRYFPSLQSHHVVHHHDGNNHHNNVHNLAVFASQSDHMKFHHGCSVLLLWDGRLV